ncbi:putative acyl-CoA synthetase YngI [Pecten maximus]|uniref:putative acyl-CoA synthetase YngI n=1 Tax=Pecten maximus TaxID=6579 RepID=UPI001458D554|nr:putative acyl-CoA synthetase YngI [Pecten maximus]
MDDLSYLNNPQLAPYTFVTINDVIKKNAASIPDTEAFVYRPASGPRQSITYTELYDRATGVARFLVSSGVKIQDKVGLFGPNSLARVVAEFGILLSGAVVLQLNIEFKNAMDAVDILNKSDCRLLFVDPGNDDNLLPVIESLESTNENNPQNRQYIFLRRTNFSHLVHTDIDEIVKSVDVDAVLPEVRPEDDALIFTTSGSTGKPKMVVHSHLFATRILQLIPEQIAVNRITYNDRPFCWVGGSVLVSSMLGHTKVFMDSNLATAENGVKKIWDIMREEKVKSAYMMPYTIHDWIAEKMNIPDDGFRLEMITTGGQILNGFYTQVVGRFCRVLMIGYGSSESGGVAVSSPIYEGDVFETGKIGPPVPGVEIRIVDEDGCLVQRGSPGNIEVRSAYLMKRYHADTAMTDAIFTTDEPPWLKTGDVGLLTASGDVIVRGRRSETISRGGRKILPGAVDDVLKGVEGVNHVTTVAVPDARMYEEVCVCFVSSTLTPGDVQSFCEHKFVNKDSLDGMGYMPRYFLKFDEFPMTYTGKTDMAKLKMEATRKLNLVE